MTTTRRPKTISRLTKNGKRRGRPPKGMAREAYDEPLIPSEISAYRKPRKGLTTLDIVRAVLSRTRPKYAEHAAGKSTRKNVERIARHFRRLKRHLADTKGEDTL